MSKVIFDNGSIGSKLLQKELKDAQVVKVSGNDLVEQFTKFDPNEEERIYLPFTVEDLVENNEQLRRNIQKVESLGFKNQIVLPYEGDNRETIKYRAKVAGIKDADESLKGVEPTKVELDVASVDQDDEKVSRVSPGKRLL